MLAKRPQSRDAVGHSEESYRLMPSATPGFEEAMRRGGADAGRGRQIVQWEQRRRTRWLGVLREHPDRRRSCEQATWRFGAVAASQAGKAEQVAVFGFDNIRHNEMLR